MSFSPSHYDLDLDVFLEDCLVNGHISVDVDYVGSESFSLIQMHALHMTVSSAQVVLENGEIFNAKSIHLNAEKEVVDIELERECKHQPKFKLKLDFTYPLKEVLHGFYRSKYRNPSEDVVRYMASTHFEPTHARKAFPCFDEPAKKATFNISITADAGLLVLSNMPEKSREGSNRIKFVFETTPKMSTYLIAFAVGDFDCVHDVTESGTDVRVYTTKHRSEHGKFALQVAVKTIPYFERFFGVKYPLKKADLIAVADYPIGAMENWGLITFRETCLLTSPSSSASDRETIAEVVSHELAHMWFGNLVTMRDWGDLWLKEGFATWISFLARDFLYPEWDVWTRFMVESMSLALDLDAMKSTHPIRVSVSSSAEISTIFDRISYEKGCSIIRMLSTYMGIESFQKGLQLYLNRHSYGCTETRDLWEALEECSGLPIGEIMEAFVTEEGFPCVTVSVGGDCGDSTKLVLAQERFRLSEDIKEMNRPWKIPLIIGVCSSASLTPTPKLMSNAEEQIEVACGVGDAVMLNAGGTSFFRTVYKGRLQENLHSAIKSGLLTNPRDRFCVLSDIVAACKAKKLPLIEILNLLQHWGHETCPDILLMIKDALNVLRMVILRSTESKSTISKFDTFANGLFTGHLSQGWEFSPETNHNTLLLIETCINATSCFHDPKTKSTGLELFHKFIKENIRPNPQCIQTVFSCGVCDDLEGSAKIQDIYSKMEDADGQMVCVRALAAANVEEKFTEIMHWMKTYVRKNQVGQFFLRIAGSSEGHRHNKSIARFISEEWDSWIVPTFGDAANLIAPFIKAWGYSCVTDEQTHEFISFMESHIQPFAVQAFNEAKELLQWRKQLLGSQSQELLQWIDKNL